MLYRVHEGPPPDKLVVLRDFLKTSALQLGGGAAPMSADYAKLLDGIRERPDFDLLQTVLLRSLSQAQYRPENEGHFGLSQPEIADEDLVGGVLVGTPLPLRGPDGEITLGDLHHDRIIEKYSLEEAFAVRRRRRRR